MCIVHHAATHCNTLQHTATHHNAGRGGITSTLARYHDSRLGADMAERQFTEALRDGLMMGEKVCVSVSVSVSVCGYVWVCVCVCVNLLRICATAL